MAHVNESVLSYVNFLFILESPDRIKVLNDKEIQGFWGMVKEISEYIRPRNEKAWIAAIEELNRTVENMNMMSLRGRNPVQGQGFYQNTPCIFLGQEQEVTLTAGNRKVCMKIVPDDDWVGAGYLTPAECIVIIRELLIPGLDLKNATFQGLIDFVPGSEHGE